MEKYHNVMENLVKERLAEIWDTLDCCKCERCKNDIIAFTLNQMPPKYVVSNEGELYARVGLLTADYEIEVLKAIATALRAVNEHPNHSI